MTLPVAEYIQKLKSHDWNFGLSKDRLELISMQRSWDKDFKIWNQHCPKKFRIERKEHVC